VVAGEPQLNPVLLYVLEENYAVRIEASAVLAECGGEDELGHWRIDPECVFSSIERTSASVQGFAVKRRVILANFQFAKMAMVEDLKKNGDPIASSAIVAAIAGHSASRQKLAQAVSDMQPGNSMNGLHPTVPRPRRGLHGIALVVVGKAKLCRAWATRTGRVRQLRTSSRRAWPMDAAYFRGGKQAALDAVIKQLSHRMLASLISSRFTAHLCLARGDGAPRIALGRFDTLSN
jgi:hypothetical protein